MDLESRRAVAEQLLLLIKREDEHKIYMQMTSKDQDQSNLRLILRHELLLGDLLNDHLDSDIIVPKLIVCGIRTISPFHYASLRGADGILSIFLKQMQVPVNITLSGGTTALHLACFAGMLTTVQMLIKRFKADYTKLDSYGWTGLHYACIGGQITIVRELCEYDRKLIPLRDKDGTTAAYRANLFEHRDVVDYFRSLYSAVDDDGFKLFDIDQQDDLYAVAKADTQKYSAGSFPSSATTDDIYSSVDKNNKINNSCDDNNHISAVNNNANKNNNHNKNNAAHPNTKLERQQQNQSCDEKKFISDNAYDLPDDNYDDKMVSRIQCKYIPTTTDQTNKISTSKNRNGSDSLSSQKSKDRERSKMEVERLIEKEFKSIFQMNNNNKEGNNYDDNTINSVYLNPIVNKKSTANSSSNSAAKSSNSAAIPSSDNRNSAADLVGCDGGTDAIGYQTLKQILRKEFFRLKEETRTRDAKLNFNNNNNNNKDKDKENGEDPKMKGLAPIYYNQEEGREGKGGEGRGRGVGEREDSNDNIYDEIGRLSLRENKENRWVKGGETLRKKSSLPPPLPPLPPFLPPRSSGIITTVFDTYSNSNQKNGNIYYSNDANTYKNLAVQQEDFNKDFNEASKKLNLMEDVLVTLESCFAELVSVLSAADDWRQLARFLPLREISTATENRIKTIEAQFPKDYRKQAEEALKDWQKHYGKQASLEVFLNALKRCSYFEKIRTIVMSTGSVV